MMADSNDVSTREQRLQDVLAGFYEAGEKGRQPDRQELLDRHPELAADLIEFFAIQEQIHRVAEPFRAFESKVEDDRVIGDYELMGEIARGGMGIVYRARQRSLNRLVALKVIRDGSKASDDDARRFRNEAEAVANFDHPNIVPIHEVGDHRGCSFFSLKLVEGGSLAERLKEYGTDSRGGAVGGIRGPRGPPRP